MHSSKQTGNLGEDIAIKYLEKKGYKILNRNYKNKWGELDIVAKDKGKIIFLEVKTIHKDSDFQAEDEINPKKHRQLLKMAQIYLSENKLPQDIAHQIDILAIEIDLDDNIVEIRHHENAIENTF